MDWPNVARFPHVAYREQTFPESPSHQLFRRRRQMNYALALRQASMKSRREFMRIIWTIIAVMVTTVFGAPARAQTDKSRESSSTNASTQSAALLWHKLENSSQQMNHDLDGTMGVAILDLTDGRTLLLNPDIVFAQASSIKVAVLAELYHQQQQSEQGIAAKAKLTDVYTVDARDIVDGSAIMA